MNEQQQLREALGIIKRVEIQVWDGHICQAVREIGKLRPLQGVLTAHQEILYRIGYNLRDGRHPDAHAELLRLQGRLVAEYRDKYFPTEPKEIRAE